MIVSMTPEEMLGAVIVGARRMIVSMQASLANVAGCERKWDDDDCRRAPNGRPAAWFIPQKRLDPL